MANNFKDFVVAAMQEAGMNDDQVIAALDKLAGSDKIGTKLNGILKTATEDYNAQVGRVNTLTQRNEYLEKDWYPKADASYKQLQTEYQKVLGELQRAQATGLPPEFDPKQYMTKDDMERFTQTMGQRLGSVVKDVSRLASRHAVNYKEELDTEALDQLAVKMAADRGLPPGSVPIVDVYEKFIEPRKKAAEEEGRKNWEKETRAQIERDLRSQNNLPTNPAPVEQSQMFRPTPTDQIPKDLDMELLATWNSAPNGSGH
jgi:hypothetical protein